ncbi:DNA excision repair protein ERCC-6 isoform X2 [Nomia melanderi]|uniref:DNA excision repair protein ERCC-6 isoform X2 n=1 Tax=Nomia melanderi TaxID=2448451 RepID=UPI001303F9C8|nr:DNA excision repair protein ERCC-6-like isoform X2 [Nomia melanderi]
METDDQEVKEADDEKTDPTNDNDIIRNVSEKVLSVRSEESILREASEEIENIIKTNVHIEKSEDVKNDEDLKNRNVNNVQRVELEKQVLTGEITPFQAISKQSNSSKSAGSSGKSFQLLDLEKYIQQQAELARQRKELKEKSKLSKDGCQKVSPKKSKISKTNPKEYKIVEQPKLKSSKRKLVSENEKTKNLMQSCNYTNKTKEVNDSNIENKQSINTTISCNALKDNTKELVENTDVVPANIENDSDSEYIPSDEQIDSEDESRPSQKKKKISVKPVHKKRVLDDGDEQIYRQRLEESGHPTSEPLHKIDNLFKIPQSIWKKLYKYQKVSVQWMWELHCRNLGGLLGDEMGLGKTVQIIAFLAGLDCSELLSDGGRFRGLGPSIIVCPATLMEQWVKHFHEWWPILRVVVLHQSGTYNGNLEYLIHSLGSGGILITSYSGVLNHKDLLVANQWHYVILDEGHKIRNPQAKVSKAVKEFSTPHRLLLTGSPMQNSLKELWSLFDFILPGKLGTLPAFLEHCVTPITRGGYANASPLQEATALQVATMLKDAITPYMLRRTKNDVQHHVTLPEKNEQVLFCSLTDEQKKLYKKYLSSEDVSFVLHEKTHMEGGRYRARLLIALSALRKICNHPDLFLFSNPIESDEDIDVSEESLEKFGCWKRSGKMTVVRSLLKIWKKQAHRVLLFTQGRQMMHILESLVQSEDYKYLRMDGTTPMSQRQEIIRLFNNDSSYFAFLLTTRVGGLGVNLTGANRVIIYDPDWNPATDAQARERAWRIGQNKRVTVYRLITAGTIEEKIYHRQIFKLLLSNKVLEDPRQRRLFKTSDLVELFNLNESIDGHSSESDLLFRDSKLTPTVAKFSTSKIEKMRKLAVTLSKNISKQTLTPASTIQSTTASESNCMQNDNSEQDDLKGTDRCTITEEKNKSSPHEQNEETSRIQMNAESNVKKKRSLENDEDNSPEKTVNDNSEVESKTNCLDVDTGTEVESRNDVGSSSCNDLNITEASENSCKTSKATSLNNNEDIRLKSHKSHHKHKRKKKNSSTEGSEVSAIFEGERVSHLIGRRLGRSEKDEVTPSEDDQYVLKKLFAKMLLLLSNMKQYYRTQDVIQIITQCNG